MLDDLTSNEFKLNKSELPAWSTLRLLAYYRLILSLAFLFTFFLIPNLMFLGYQGATLFVSTMFVYVTYSGISIWLVNNKRISFTYQIYLNAFIDIFAILIAMYTSGGIASGLGMLLVVNIAIIGVFCHGKQALAFAAGISLVLLLEHGFRVLGFDGSPNYFLQVGLLGVTFFMTAIIANILSSRVVESESLAAQRGEDLANMGQLNEYIIQRMGSGVLVIDDKKQIRLMNEAAAYLLGIPVKSNGLAIEQVSDELATQLGNWIQDEAFDTQVFRVTGSVAIYPRFTRLGLKGYAGTLVLLEDTSMLNQQAQHLKLTALGRLTASIAHEIRNPLGAISHAGQLLEESNNLDKADRRLTQIIREQSVRMNTIIENVMRLTSRDNAAPELITLSDWLTNFVEEFARTHDIQVSKIDIDINPKDVTVYMDASHLHQILSNLCQNGIRHSSDNGNTILKLRGGETVESRGPFLDVIDNGSGIQPEMSDQIFEPFFTTANKGTGLGLYIARELAEANQAHLDYVPVPTSGSCFRISFSKVKRQT